MFSDGAAEGTRRKKIISFRHENLAMKIIYENPITKLLHERLYITSYVWIRYCVLIIHTYNILMSHDMADRRITGAKNAIEF